MTDRDAKKAEIKSLFAEAASPPPPRKPRAPRAKPAPTAGGNMIIVNGAGVAAHQIAGGDIHNHSYAKAPARPKIVVQPGVGVITEDQKATITALRAEWLALHATIKKNPLSDRTAWTKINAAAGVTSYKLIPLERFDQVVAFIKVEMAKLRGMASAPAKDDGWRKSRIGAIKARSKNQLGNPEAYKDYIKKNFKADSLTALSTDQLRKTYTHIMGKTPPA